MATQSAASSAGRQGMLPASRPTAAPPAHSKQAWKAVGLGLVWFPNARSS